MDGRLKPYRGYKETKLLWLANVPKHWDVKINKSIWVERKTVNCINKPLLSVTIKKGVILQSELLTSSSKKDSSNLDKTKYKLIQPNDLVYNKMRMWQGAVGISEYRGIVSPAYIVLKPIRNINHRYYHYLLRTPGYVKESFRNSYGICDDQLSLRYEDFKCMHNIIPPKEEQDQIVRYLDSKLTKIDKFLINKKRLIELLKEQKQAIINQAVTKGLNPHAQMKPSGIEWLGDIPETMEIVRLKNLSKVNPTINLNKYSLDDRVVFLPMEKISENGHIDNSEFREIQDVKNGFTGFARNDVVVAKITPCFENGKGACLDSLKSDIGYGTTELIVLRPSNKILPKYLYFITRTDCFRILGEEVMTGSAGQKRVPVQFVSSFKLGVPDIERQRRVLTYIEEKIQIIDGAVERIKKEISLINEYRTSLISSVVTGQVDVRNIQVEEAKVDLAGDAEHITDLDDEAVCG
ncbi:MAG: restriction endonuclease subunit S [Peptococcaceae bacterium]|nr:restriction endonuclease subunit S [Candidatus Syntrophopropionicum ammoniitolerans]